MSKGPWRNPVITKKELAFATLVARGISATKAYRVVYRARNGVHRPGTERTEAYLIRRKPKITQLIEQLKKGQNDPEVTKFKALAALDEIANGMREVKYAPIFQAQLRQAERDLHRRWRLAEALEADPQRWAWRLFWRSLEGVAQAKRTRDRTLSLEQPMEPSAVVEQALGDGEPPGRLTPVQQAHRVELRDFASQQQAEHREDHRARLEELQKEAEAVGHSVSLRDTEPGSEAVELRPSSNLATVPGHYERVRVPGTFGRAPYQTVFVPHIEEDHS